jgi:hypothetical protein
MRWSLEQAMRWSLEQMMEELHDRQSGGFLVE